MAATTTTIVAEMSTAPDNDRTLISPRTALAAPPAGASSSSSSAGDSGNALPVGAYLAEFEVTGVIGEGGFGIVYNAWDHSLERRVALKEYMPASLAMRDSTQVQVRSQRHRETFDAGRKSFINEAKLLAKFDHPSLVKVYRFWEANGTAYMVMPLYLGVTLKDKLRALSEAPDEAWLMAMLAPLTEALAVIHSDNCFHRDIAPDNVILLEGSERPLLLDFGAARRVIGDMTQALTVILKPGYAPVEQYAETPNMKQGAWTDIYALAASIHYAILGRTPPPSVSRLMSDSFVPMSQSAAGQYSERFLTAMDRALSVRPEERTQSIAALREDLGLEPLGANEPNTRMRTIVATQAAVPRTVSTAAATLAPDDEKTRIAPRTPGPQNAPTKGSAAPAPVSAPSRTGLWVGVGVAALLLAGAAGYLLWGGTAAKSSAPTTSTAPSARPAVDPLPASTPLAPTPLPTAPPATVVRPEFNVQAEFDKVMSAQTAGYTVTATPARPQLRIGRDKLAFEVSSSRDGYVQVLLLGPDQSLVLLYPNSAATAHAIKAGQRLVLPQANWPLLASEPTGPEHFLVVVSSSPRDYSALVQGNEYIFKKLPTGAAAAEIAARHSGAMPLLLGAPGKKCSADCDVFGAALFSLEVTR